MPTYIVNWNPERFNWTDVSHFIAETAAGRMPEYGWSTGKRTSVREGDRIFMFRQGKERGLVGSGYASGDSYTAEHWDKSRDDEANYVEIRWDTLLEPEQRLRVEKLIAEDVGVPWDNLYGSGVAVPQAEKLERLWENHLIQIGRIGPKFQVGRRYTRNDIYKILEVPKDKQGGDWDTGYHRHGDDFFVFCAVGTTGRTGHDYGNYWDGDELVWRGKTGSKESHPQIQAMLRGESDVYIFTRERDRDPFTYEGLAKGTLQGSTIPVTIRWRFGEPSEVRDETLPNEVIAPETLTEGAVQRITINAYERNPAARRKCIEEKGVDCCVCGFNFANFYGLLGDGFIHIHHLRDLASIGEEYVVNPIDDLDPVCPNCHAMLHRKRPAMSIEALRAIIKQQELSNEH